MESDEDRMNVASSSDVTNPTDKQPGRDAYSLLALSKMNAFRKRGHLCDVVIKVGGREFLAHRVVLAATSDYFNAMFSNGMAESAQLEVELKSISPDIMDALLDYVYTGQVHVTMENVQDLLPAASLVQMEGVKVACSSFLLAEVDASNVLGIRRFAELHSCAELEKFARNYAAHNFELVVEYEEFLCLNHEELLDLIVREDLRIDCEESVYKAVMRWVYHQVAERAPHLPNLLLNIRLPVMSVRFLTDIVDKDLLIRQSLECRDSVDDAKRFHLRPDLRHEMRDRRYHQRDGGDEYLVVIGGFGSDQNPSDSVEMFNPRTLEWSELPDLPVSYRYVAACSLDTCVYVIGGFDGRERLNTVCLLDIAHRDEGWRWLTPMHYKRGLSAACTHKGLIYVCGGFDGQSRLRSLEVYHPKIDEWRILEDMTTAREGAGLVVVDDTLYCLGGYDGSHLLNSMEAFSLRHGTWSACKPMYMRRSGAGCALLGDTIYVCGGYGGAEGRGPLHLDTVEAYHTRLQQWTLVTSMNVARCYVGACPLAGKIYVAAGYNGSRLLNTVESYDPLDNVWWLHDDCRMNHERCDTGMCVVRFLSCAEPPIPSQAGSTSSRSMSVASTVLPADATSRSAAVTTVSSGLAMTIRPPVDAHGHRIPMLPLITTQLNTTTTISAAAAVPNLFRPLTDSRFPHSSDTPSEQSSRISNHSRVGLPCSTALSFASTTSHPTPGQSDTRTICYPPLSRHLNLPNRQPFHRGLSAGSHLPPGFSPPIRIPTSSRSSHSSYARATTQVLAVTSGGDNLWTGLAMDAGLPSRHSSTPVSAETSDFVGTSHLFSMDTHASDEQQPLSESFSCHLDHYTATATAIGSMCSDDMWPNQPFLQDSERTIMESDECRQETPSFPDLPNMCSQTIEFHPSDDGMERFADGAGFRGSNSSSPTLNRNYHSAPISSSDQPCRPDLCRSAEALDLTCPPCRLWVDRDGSSPSYVDARAVVGRPPDICSSRDDRGAYSPQTPDDIHADSIFGLPGLDNTLVEGYSRDTLSEDSGDDTDSVAHSPIGSGRAVRDFANLNLIDNMTDPEAVETTSTDCTLADSTSLSFLPAGDAGLATDENTFPRAITGSGSADSLACCSSTTGPPVTSCGDCTRWPRVFGPSCGRSKVKPTIPHPTMVDQRWPRRYCAEERNRYTPGCHPGPVVNRIKRSACDSLGIPSTSCADHHPAPSILETGTDGSHLTAPNSGISLHSNEHEFPRIANTDHSVCQPTEPAPDLHVPTQVVLHPQPEAVGLPDEHNNNIASDSRDLTGAHSSTTLDSAQPTVSEELRSNSDSRSDGEGEEEEEEDAEDPFVSRQSPAVGRSGGEPF